MDWQISRLFNSHKLIFPSEMFNLIVSCLEEKLVDKRDQIDNFNGLFSLDARLPVIC
jgi:hypothetical protein